MLWQNRLLPKAMIGLDRRLDEQPRRYWQAPIYSQGIRKSVKVSVLLPSTTTRRLHRRIATLLRTTTMAMMTAASYIRQGTGTV